MLVIIFIMQAITFFVIINNMPDDAQAKAKSALSPCCKEIINKWEEKKPLIDQYQLLHYLLEVSFLGKNQLQAALETELKQVQAELTKMGFPIQYAIMIKPKKPCKKKK